MSSTFVPPAPSQWEGPAQQQQQGQFVPPPVSAWQGPSSQIGPSFPQGNQSPNLPEMTNEDLKKAGRKALDYLPYVAGAVGGIVAPEALPAVYPFLAGVGGAAAGGALGEAARQGTLAATGSPGAPQSVGEAAKNVGSSALEQGAMEAGGRMLAAPLEYAAGKIFSPTRMYQSALKPSPAMNKSLADSADELATSKLVQSGLDRRIPVSEAGYNKVVGQHGELQNQIKKIVLPSGDADYSGAMVNPIDVAARLDDLAKNSAFAKQAVNKPDIETIQNVRQAYLEKHGAKFDSNGGMVTPPNPMTPLDAQIEKQATYAVNRQNYGQLSAVQNEAEKSLARGLKEEIAGIYPEIGGLNAEDSALLSLEQSLRKFVGREGNKNLIGMVPGMLGAGAAVAGAASGHAEGGAAAGLLTLAVTALDNPEIKSKLAIALNRAKNSAISKATPSRVIPSALRMGQAVYNANQDQ